MDAVVVGIATDEVEVEFGGDDLDPALLAVGLERRLSMSWTRCGLGVGHELGPRGAQTVILRLRAVIGQHSVKRSPSMT